MSIGASIISPINTCSALASRFSLASIFWSSFRIIVCILQLFHSASQLSRTNSLLIRFVVATAPDRNHRSCDCPLDHAQGFESKNSERRTIPLNGGSEKSLLDGVFASETGAALGEAIHGEDSRRRASISERVIALSEQTICPSPSRIVSKPSFVETAGYGIVRRLCLPILP